MGLKIIDLNLEVEMLYYFPNRREEYSVRNHHIVSYGLVFDDSSLSYMLVSIY